MSDLKPIGSEKLKGQDKIKRIMEIARYGESPRNNELHTETNFYTKKAPNGVHYSIVQEKDGYYLKSGLNESAQDYLHGVGGKKRDRFRSYGAALKKLNLIFKPIIMEYTDGKGTSMFEDTDMDVDMDVLTDLTDDEMEMGEQKSVIAVDIPDTEPAMEDMGMEDDMGMEGDMGDDMGDEDMGMEDDMVDDMGDEEEEIDVDVDVEGEMSIKPIQKLTGKLGQKLRDFADELESDDIKYVLNSIISAVDLDKLSMEDKDDITSRFEDDDEEYGMEDKMDIDVSDEEFEMGDDEMGMEDEGMDVDVEDEGDMLDMPEGYKSIRESVEKVIDKYVNPGNKKNHSKQFIQNIVEKVKKRKINKTTKTV